MTIIINIWLSCTSLVGAPVPADFYIGKVAVEQTRESSIPKILHEATKNIQVPVGCRIAYSHQFTPKREN